MKELGEKLRTAREKTGITIEEAAGDLNYKAYDRKVKDLEEKIALLNEEILDLKHKLRTANEREEILKSSDKEITNVDLLKRISNLEKIIYGKKDE